MLQANISKRSIDNRIFEKFIEVEISSMDDMTSAIRKSTTRKLLSTAAKDLSPSMTLQEVKVATCLKVPRKTIVHQSMARKISQVEISYVINDPTFKELVF